MAKVTLAGERREDEIGVHELDLQLGSSACLLQLRQGFLPGRAQHVALEVGLIVKQG